LKKRKLYHQKSPAFLIAAVGIFQLEDAGGSNDNMD